MSVSHTLPKTNPERHGGLEDDPASFWGVTWNVFCFWCEAAKKVGDVLMMCLRCLISFLGIPNDGLKQAE